MEYPYNLTKEEVIRKIEDVYHATADLENEYFDIYDQLLACEVVSELESSSVAVNSYLNPQDTTKGTNENESVSVNDNVNGTYKRRINSELTENKTKAIAALKTCTYQTSPRKIAELLEQLFIDSDTKSGHWLFVAQNWNPRAINRVIQLMIKQHQTGEQTIKSSSAYFTFLIKRRKKRKAKRNGVKK